ncbi:MAG TPA: porin [Cyclobacteriaceae bacterium]|nr:porin [Cyclobacteriaceae bacterium]
MRILTNKVGRRLYRSVLLECLLIAAILVAPRLSFGQDKKTVPDGTTGLVLEVGPEDYLKKKRPPNEFEGTYSTIRIGFGYILDGAAYGQSAVFKQQMDSAGLVLDPKLETRDFRIMTSGVLKTKRTLAWKAGFMYDGDKKVWLLRETGLTIGVPELFGHIFIGRTKEGYSLVKVMNGHFPWTAERQMALDVIPILADGIKYFGSLPKSRLFWNLGYFNDVLSKGQSFSTYAWQYDARIGWLPFYDKEKNRVLHIAGNFRYGKPIDGKITLKSRPESNPAPQIINTGEFSAEHSNHFGAEMYYSTGRLLLGSEVMVHQFNAGAAEDHSFFGGDIVATYIFTKTKRTYTTTGNIFEFVPVTKSVFKGGWGEWEAVLRFSTLDLDDGSIHGGKFWRFTPMVNWYMTKAIRTEFIYGYGVLDRYNLKGSVQIFQCRIQFTVM